MGGPTDAIRVLHVDDEPDFADMAAAFLEREDDRFVVGTATSADDGLDRLDGGDVDCVVSDYDMPGLNGIEFLEAVRERDPDLPFILYTGKGSEEVASDAISAGVTDYLQKASGSEQYELLANRIVNAVEQTRARHRASKQERILRILRDVNQALVTSTTRDGIEAEIASILASAEPYRSVWLGEYDAEWDRLVPRTAAGANEDAIRTVPFPEQPEGAVHDAVRTDELATARYPAPTLDVWVEGHTVEYEAAAVVPLVYQGDRYGLLVLYAARSDAFSDDERDMLAELGDDIAQALHTAETHRDLRRHRTAVEAVPEGVFILDEDATIELANERAASLLGLPIDEVEGRPFPTLVEGGIFGEDIVEWYLESVREMLSSESDREEARYETEVDPRGADPRLVEVHLTLRPYEEEFRGTVGIIRDITERKEREQERELRYEAIFNQTYQFTGLMDPDGTLLEANDTALEFGGLDREDVVGKPFWETYWWRTDEETQRELRRAIDRARDGEFVRYEVEVQGEDREITIDFSIRPVTDEEGEVVYLIPEGRNITELKGVQRRERELERQNDRLDRFVGVVSHDLRNPLNVARGRLEFAREECESEHLEDAADAVDRSLALIDDLLALAREGETVSEVEAVDIGEAIDGCWRNVETADATLVVETDRTVRADPSRLKQLLSNLIRNAVEHGGEDVTVTIGDSDGGFYVADDGPGIPEGKRERVFEPGYSTAEEGTGFGLNIVREIAEAHDWEIRVSEGSGGGARFEITGVEFVTE